MNNSGGVVDDIHIDWNSAIAAVFVARDSQLGPGRCDPDSGLVAATSILARR